MVSVSRSSGLPPVGALRNAPDSRGAILRPADWGGSAGRPLPFPQQQRVSQPLPWQGENHSHLSA